MIAIALSCRKLILYQIRTEQAYDQTSGILRCSVDYFWYERRPRTEGYDIRVSVICKPQDSAKFFSKKADNLTCKNSCTTILSEL